MTTQVSSFIHFIVPHVYNNDYGQHPDGNFSCIEPVPVRRSYSDRFSNFRQVAKKDIRLYGCPGHISYGPHGARMFETEGRTGNNPTGNNPTGNNRTRKFLCNDLIWNCVNIRNEIISKMCIGYAFAEDKKRCEPQEGSDMIKKRCISNSREAIRAVPTRKECGIRWKNINA